MELFSIRIQRTFQLVSTIFIHHQACCGSNGGEYRHPQAGQTDFRSAERQGKTDTAAGFWEQKP